MLQGIRIPPVLKAQTNVFRNFIYFTTWKTLHLLTNILQPSFAVLVKRVAAWEKSDTSIERTVIRCLAVTPRGTSELSLIILSFISTRAPKNSKPFRHWSMLLHQQLDCSWGMSFRSCRTNRFIATTRGTPYYTHSVRGGRASACRTFFEKKEDRK